MAREDWGIGVVGLGGIAQHHLTAYRQKGLRVVAGAEPDRQRRDETRERFGIPQVFADVSELAALPEVRVIDITVPHLPEVRLPVVEEALKHKKALFIQKPLMPKIGDAARIVRLAEQAGVPLMVNQNSLFASGFLAAYDILRADPCPLGRLYYCQIDNRNWFDLSGHPWFAKHQRWVTSDMGVHHLALVHHWFGRAETVYAAMARDASQARTVGENVSALTIGFESGVQAIVINNWAYRGSARRAHPYEEVVVQGDDGCLTATSTKLELAPRTGDKTQREFAEPWFPNAFGEAMAHYIDHLESGEPWWCDGRDNLHVIAIIEAAYKSATEGVSVRVKDMETAGA